MPHISTVAFPLESKATRHITLSLCCVVLCSVPKLCLTLWDFMDSNMLGLAVLQYLPKFVQVHVHCINDAIQPSHPLMPSSALNLSQHQGLFQWVGCLHQVPNSTWWDDTGASSSASVLPMSIQCWFPLRLTGLISLLSEESSLVPQFEDIDSLVLYFPYSPALTTICDHWEDHSFDYSRALN